MGGEFMKKSYYRAIHTKDGACDCGLLTPEPTVVERVNEFGDPVYRFGTFWASPEEVLCFSENVGGAVIGATTGEEGFRGGEYCICKTEEIPDVDMTHVTIGDFEVLEEVRFKRPVMTTPVGAFKVTPELLAEIEKAYDCQFPTYEEFVESEGEEMAILHYDQAMSMWESQEGCPINIDKLLDIRERITEEVLK